MNVLLGSTTAGLTACIRQVIGVLERWSLFADTADPTLVVGPHTVTVPPGRWDLGVAVVPVPSTHQSPSARAILRHANSFALLDESDAGLVGVRDGSRPIVVTGLPRPPVTHARRGFHAGDANPTLRHLLHEHVGHITNDCPGIAWIGGSGSTVLIEAGRAWAEHRAVIALPGTPRLPLLARGGALFASSALHVVEATRFLLETPALTITLAARGARALESLPTLEAVAGRVAEALELARRGTAAGLRSPRASGPRR